MIDCNYIQGAVMICLGIVQLLTRPYIREIMAFRGRKEGEIRRLSLFSVLLSSQVIIIGISAILMASAGMLAEGDPDEQQIVLGLSFQILSVAAQQLFTMRGRCLKIRQMRREGEDGGSPRCGPHHRGDRIDIRPRVDLG